MFYAYNKIVCSCSCSQCYIDAYLERLQNIKYAINVGLNEKGIGSIWSEDTASITTALLRLVVIEAVAFDVHRS